MFGGRKITILLFALAALGLLFLPIWPGTQTARVDLRTAEVRNTSTLLGENLPDPDTPTPDARPTRSRPAAGAMTLTVPKLGLRDVVVPSGSRQSQLDREGVLHVGDSGLPWEEGSNTFIAGHALGFPRTRVPRAFHDLDDLAPGDEILIRSADGHDYAFEVYDRLTVEPGDTWVTHPVEGRTVISLQTCVPIPTFENRLIVRGELVS